MGNPVGLDPKYLVNDLVLLTHDITQPVLIRELKTGGWISFLNDSNGLYSVLQGKCIKTLVKSLTSDEVENFLENARENLQ